MEEATGRETIIESTTNAMILIVDHYHHGCVYLFLRATFSALASRLVFLKEREREREREREIEFLFLNSFRVVSFSLCCCVFFYRARSALRC